jgi:hypothetical protein
MRDIEKLFPLSGELEDREKLELERSPQKKRAQWLHHPCTRALLFHLYSRRASEIETILDGAHVPEERVAKVDQAIGGGQAYEEILGWLANVPAPITEEEMKEDGSGE